MLDVLRDREQSQAGETGGEVLEDALESPETALAEMDLGAGDAYGADDEAPAPAPEAQMQATAPAFAGSVQQQPMPAAPSVGSGSTALASSAEDFESAIGRPDTDTRRHLPTALHRQARSQRAAGDCRTAVRSYEQLLSRYRTYAQAPEAMIEAAGCYRRLGQLSTARRWLERASQTSRVRAQAQRELAELSAAERAHEAAAAAAEARE